MKIKWVLTFLAIAGWSVCTRALAGDISGFWETADHLAIISIQPNGPSYEGSIAALKEPRYPVSDGPQWEGKTKVDQNNPEPSLRMQPLIGLVLVHGFLPDGPNQWRDGRIYNPADGHFYQCKAWLSEDGQHLSVRGFYGISLLGQTQQWTRLASPVFPDAAH